MSLPIALTQPIIARVLSIVAQSDSPHTSFAPPPRLISLLRSLRDLAGFLCKDGRALFCSSHGYPQEAPWKGWAIAPALTFLNSLPFLTSTSNAASFIPLPKTLHFSASKMLSNQFSGVMQYDSIAAPSCVSDHQSWLVCKMEIWISPPGLSL